MSSNTQHTPGPWFSGCHGSEVIQVVTEDEKLGGAKNLIASVNKWISMDCNGRSDEANANARLIAAAPDLLEALREIAASSPSSNRVGFIARAAIAKATEGK